MAFSRGQYVRIEDPPTHSRYYQEDSAEFAAALQAGNDEFSHTSSASFRTEVRMDTFSKESNKSYPKNEFHLELGQRTSAVKELARSYSKRSHKAAGGSPYASPFMIEADPSLNPSAPNFNATKWAKSIVELTSRDRMLRSAGVCFQNLNVHGFHAATDFQKTVGNVWLSLASTIKEHFSPNRQEVDILRQCDGLVGKGEMMIVLGPPGSGCSTFLKTIAGDTNGLHVDYDSYFNYQGLRAKELHTHHRGEAIYTAEVDVHFPMMTVGDTLTFASRARKPRQLPLGFSGNEYSDHLRDVIMAMFGISHTFNTPVGDDTVRGVSGGERKRVTIAEAALSGAPLQCWDNSTRGLDSANAIEFCKTLRLQADVFDITSCVSIYQAPQSAYDLFDKAMVLYEGRQIFFGKADEAKQYFIDLGFDCPPRQTTPDFLTSMTSPLERIVRPGFEGRVPNTPDDFATAWKKSVQYTVLEAEIEQYKIDHPLDGVDALVFRASKEAQQARGQRRKSPYILSYPQQIQLCLWRGLMRLKGDPSLTIGALVGNLILSLVVGSVFFNLNDTTSSFVPRGTLIFFSCLLNGLSSLLEILTLFAQRPIVEKHVRYALYHPSAEAVSSFLCDLPNKIIASLVFNLTLYFMTNLRREPGPFFFFLLISFSTVLVMSMIFRTIASVARSLFQALVPAGILMLNLIIFTGFVIPTNYMLGWCRWINYIDPLAYAFESLVVNEFHNRQFKCNNFVPNRNFPEYASVESESQVCNSVGARPGKDFVLGDDYASATFGYEWGNRWRNFGIMILFTVLLFGCYLVAAELISEKKSKGEVLVYPRSQKPVSTRNPWRDYGYADLEASGPDRGPVTAGKRGRNNFAQGKGLQQQKSIFQWHNVCYDIKIKKDTRRILDHVDGWVKPGTLTALMGVSGAGKTSLLDCLADRISVGVITGEMLVDGRPRDMSFQRKTGYVQQQDLHLQTSTVREALNFSAVLRQPSHVPREEKLAYVEEIIDMLDMSEYANAIIGLPGEGLNIEQRKRLTIAIELVAKPPLLLFVDEPTSGLDSQTSWAILDLLQKLTKVGQAVLCTIHQPSSMLFQQFDRLLLLSPGGKTVYFGDIGQKAETLTKYFESNGARPCPADANPAEWMLEVIGDAPGATTEIDWFKVWRKSPQYNMVQTELEKIKMESLAYSSGGPKEDPGRFQEFAAPFTTQLQENLRRVFQQYWRTPTYIYSKMALCTIISLFIGFIFFQAPTSIQGLQSQMFSIFCLMTIFGQVVQQSIPQFVIQRGLYEARERPSKVYSWKVFMLSQIIVEIPWNSLMAVLMFFCWYYPVGLYRNAEEAGQVTERGALVFLFLWMFMVFAGTYSILVVCGFDSAAAGANLGDLMFTLSLIFCGVLATPEALPGFWIFMYRVSPLTYLVSGLLSSGVANTRVICADNEFLTFKPMFNSTCFEYMKSHIENAGGYLVSNDATSDCQFCPISESNKYLETVSTYYKDRWRNFGILWVYLLFNIGASLLIYWLARVPKTSSDKKKKA
ncbi:unnamed protein product [Clonostachys byssicola]|uniref:ABC transporter domain-containing protein n=1 Tax=Clonostachys byssicola TaxID=160290 RepID=A0A9N9U661_9HYPO|nr:unnamed protein product [Clonostachys byssicola]